MALVATLGRIFLGFLAGTGRLALFAGAAIGNAFAPPIYLRLIGRQMINVGYFSLPVVGLTAVFTGMVLALQSYTGFSRFNAESAIANSDASRPMPLPRISRSPISNLPNSAVPMEGSRLYTAIMPTGVPPFN